MSVEQQVRAVVQGYLGLTDGETKEADILADLPMDSLDEVELIMCMEEEFALEISDEEAAEFKTVKQIADYIGEAQRV